MTKRSPVDYLSKKFIVYLILVVVLISAAANYLRFEDYRDQVVRDMDDHVAMTLGYVSNFSLHYIDEYEVELLADLQSFTLHDKNITYLVINNYLTGEKYGNKPGLIPAGIKEYHKDLLINDRLIGRVEMGFDGGVYDARINDFMIASWQIVAIVAIALVGFIFVFYKRNIAREISRFRSALDGSSDAIYLIDKKSLRFVDSNKKGWDLLGYSRDQLFAHTLVDLCTVCDACSGQDSLCFNPGCEMLSGKRLYFKAFNGGIIPMEVFFDDITYGSDDLLIAVARDIRLAIKAEKELLAAKESAEKASKAKSEFLSCMSHELRTPLNAVLGFGQLLEMTLTDEDEKENVRYILGAGNHLLSLVNDVLDLSRIDSGNLELNIKGVDPVPLIKDCANMAGPMAKKYTVSVVLDESCHDLPAIKADQSRFKQVLLNILSNAIKYNKMGGTVIVSCQVLSAGMLRIKVKDTGIGIPVSRYCELFTPFHRLGAEGGPIEGAGIGLSMTKQLVRMMSGKIDFDSEEGKGSLFWFDLPVSTNITTESVKSDLDIRPRPLARLDNEKSFRILYIEDNPSNQSLMQGVLATLPGVELKCIHNAEMGLEYIAHSRVNLVLMDIDLPGMNGIEATKLLKQDENTRHIPVIAITANAMQSDIDYAKTVGFDHYLTKPFDVAEILSIIASKFNQ